MIKNVQVVSLVLITGFLGLFNYELVPEEKQIDDVQEPESKLVVGATMEHSELTTDIEKLYLKDFKYLTPANAAKQSKVHPCPDVWRWEALHDFITFGNQHDLEMRIHSPIGPQCSKWVKEDRRTKEELSRMLVSYMMGITKFINREPKVKWMDVVNETVFKGGRWFGPKEGVDSWENPWLKIGVDDAGYPRYILKAFEIATKYAPNVKLIYNQHMGMDPKAWRKIKETVSYLRSKNCRVDGIGWQGHLLLGVKHRELIEEQEVFFKRLEALIDWAHEHDLSFHITELDYLVKNDQSLFKEREQQRKVYKRIIQLLVRKSLNGEVTLNFWSVGERVRNGKGRFQSLYDRDLKPLPSYLELKKLLSSNMKR